MIKIVRTDSGNNDFIELVRHLDAELASRNGSDNAFYSQYNKIHMIKHAVVVYEDEMPVACGAIKAFDNESMEVKRMFTAPAQRGKGFAIKVLAELETWAAELSCSKCVLETGTMNPEALALYRKSGYSIIPNYGQYVGIEKSICMSKSLK